MAYDLKLVNIYRSGGLRPQTVIRQLLTTLLVRSDQLQDGQEMRKSVYSTRHKVTWIKLHVRVHNDETNVLVTITDQHAP